MSVSGNGGAPFVSIVVPTWNRADELRVCLRGLTTQDWPGERFEIIVADDGSTDGTAEVVRDASRQPSGPAVRLVSESHAGSNAARNAGLAAAAGDPVCFIDDDVETPPTWMAAMVAGFERHPDADAFAGRVLLRVEPGARSCPLHPIASMMDLGPNDSDVEAAIGANMAIRRSAIDKVGAFDEWIWIGGADTEWFNRLNAAGRRTVYLGEALAWHRPHIGNLRIGALIHQSFVRGIGTHRYLIRLGRGGNWPRLLKGVWPLLEHAFRARCRAALATAVRQLGCAYGLWRDRSIAPPVPKGSMRG